MLPILADAFEAIVDSPMPLFIIGGTIAVVAIVCNAVTRIAITRSRERTRREIAAYVAEGTIDADKAVAMLNASEKADGEEGGCC